MKEYEAYIRRFDAFVVNYVLLTILAIALTTAGILYFSPTAEAQTFPGFTRVFAAQTGTGATASSGAIRGTPVHHAINLVVTGAPATCTYRLQGSANGTTWYNISAADITCTSSATAFETGKPTRYVRGNLLTLTGGTAPTVTLQYVGGQ